MTKYYVVADGCLSDPDDSAARIWTLSKDPENTGWETDSGYSGYGLLKEEAEFLALAANEHELLKQKLEVAVKALDEISDGYLGGEREMEARASVALMDIKDLGGK